MEHRLTLADARDSSPGRPGLRQRGPQAPVVDPPSPPRHRGDLILAPQRNDHDAPGTVRTSPQRATTRPREARPRVRDPSTGSRGWASGAQATGAARPRTGIRGRALTDHLLRCQVCNGEKSPRETALDDESDIACNVLAAGVGLLAEQSGDDWRARVFLYRRWANSSTVARTSENA